MNLAFDVEIAVDFAKFSERVYFVYPIPKSCISLSLFVLKRFFPFRIDV